MSAKKKPPQPTASSAPKGGGKPASKTDRPAEKLIAENRKARHDFEILDTLECGIALVGSEVKSLRTGRMSLDEAYGRVEGGEVWLYGCDIPEYDKANQLNHKPKRPRKLLREGADARAAEGLLPGGAGEGAHGHRPGPQGPRQAGEAQGGQRPARY